MEVIEPKKYLEVFKEFPIVRRGKKPTELFEVIPKVYPLNIDEDKIKETVRQLKKKYPHLGYRIVTATINGKKCLGITRKKGIPVFFDPTEGRVYVRWKDAIDNAEKTALVVHFRLTALKIPLALMKIEE